MMLFVLTWAGFGCWIVYFWWMIRDIHPQVSEIKEHVEKVKEAVSPGRE